MFQHVKARGFFGVVLFLVGAGVPLSACSSSDAVSPGPADAAVAPVDAAEAPDGDVAASPSTTTNASVKPPLPNGGVIASTEATVDAEGGVLQLNDVMLSVPPGAVATAMKLTLSEVDPAANNAGGQSGSQLYLLEPSGTLFQQPVTLRIPFRGDLSNAAVLWWDDTNHDAYPITADNFDGEYVTVTSNHASKIEAVFNLLELAKNSYELYENIEDQKYPCGKDGGYTLIDGACYSCPGSITPVKSGGSVICCASGEVPNNGECYSCAKKSDSPFLSNGQVMCCPGPVTNNVCKATCPTTQPVAFPQPSGKIFCCNPGTQAATADGHCLGCVTAGYNLCNSTTCCSPSQTCKDSQCFALPESCTLPTVACGGGCVNPLNNIRNCGACGTACAAGKGCVAGVCTDAPDVLWLDASNPASFVKNTSGAVTSWADQSTKQISYAVGTDTQPQWSVTGGPNSKPGVTFAGASTRLTSATALPTTPQMTVFAVYRMDASPPAWATVLAQSHDTFFSLRRSALGQGNGKLNFHIGNNNDAPAIPLELASWHLVTAVQTATSTTVYSSPALPATVAQGPIASGNAKITIGNSSVGNDSLNGAIAELRVYGSALSEAQRTTIESALRTKWGLPTPYTLGGTVSGLNGTLTLANGSDTVTVSQNGSFTFPAPVAAGASYAVTVATQPAGQSCTVANGTGSVGSANVTGVTVTCTNSPRTVGGTVTGLIGTLVLRNNNGNDLTVTQNGSFTFSLPGAFGSPYSVTVATQPAGQSCTVANGSGTQGTLPVTTVAVTCTGNNYTVGGTVTGLNGTLVLRNNNGNDLTRTQNGAFTFSQPVAFGAAYSVTVFTQPAGQTCAVTAGAGTQGAQNTTSVAVTCTNNSYSIGGNVTGLNGTVVLRNNGGNDRTVTANGSFVFTQSVPFGSPYAVTVLTQPAGQTCSVGSGSGTVGPANVTNVAVTCTNNTYTVGGNVSGLNGTVVLRNNGGNDLTRTANGAFAFTTPVAFGSPYAVTVATQPAGQVCTVTNGSGTIGAANVTGVVVTCVSNTYSVGGTVSGLTGSVVLRDNGGDDLTLTANGAYAFATKVAFGGTYAVTVQTQPAGQTCTVTNGSGTMGPGNVTSANVACVNNTYTVGGSVIGLSGTIVLQNNGGNTLSLSASGPFTFSTPVAFGSPYAVTILTQPAGVACSVSAGSGTMGAGNVTSVIVNCAANQYTVGGTVSGLNGSVVLRNNGANDLTVTANGTYAFQSTVAFGGAYAVTVRTQPAGQTCTVANGSGTVGAANVTNANVTCVSNTYTVGGNLLGLIGTIVLQNNGANNLSLSASGAFTFSTPVAFGSPYAVTILTQPAGQSCSVSSGSGTMGAGNVTGVVVNCASNQYTVGGTVSGLNAGLSVALSLNGGTSLGVSASGSFTFPTPLTTGAAYSVVVVTQPTAQTCTVTNGAGTVGVTNVTNIAVACRTTVTDCGNILSTGLSTGNGVYFVDPDGVGTTPSFQVYCDMTGGGWTQVIDQDVAVAPGYDAPATWLAGVTTTAPNGGHWSVLQYLSAFAGASGYQFQIRWNTAEDKSIAWTQSTSPLVGRGTITNVVMNPTGQTGYSGAFQGLASDGPAALDGEPGTAYAWAVGTLSQFSGGIPAFQSSSAGILNSNRARLYLKRAP